MTKYTGRRMTLSFGGTTTGRFPPEPEPQGLESIGRREGQKVNYVRIPACDFADVERRALAQLSRAFGLPGSFVLATGEVVLNERAFAYFLRDPDAVDEEGCGAFFGALYEEAAWG